MACLYSVKAARALGAVYDPQKTRFAVGTLCLREDNQARVLLSTCAHRLCVALSCSAMHSLRFTFLTTTARRTRCTHKYTATSTRSGIWRRHPSTAVCWPPAIAMQRVRPAALLPCVPRAHTRAQARAAARRCGGSRPVQCHAKGASPAARASRECRASSRSGCAAQACVPGPGPHTGICVG